MVETGTVSCKYEEATLSDDVVHCYYSITHLCRETRFRDPGVSVYSKSAVADGPSLRVQDGRPRNAKAPIARPESNVSSQAR